MKKIALLTIGLALVASNAYAGGFFGARGGFEKYMADNTAVAGLDNGETDAVVGGFIGYHDSFFRLEAEYLYHPERSFNLSSGKAYKSSSQTIMGNLSFSPPMKSVWHPYVLAGAGVALHSVEYNKTDDSTAFAWQVGGGLELELTENVFFDFGGRYMDMGKADCGSEKVKTKSYSYYFGMRFEY